MTQVPALEFLASHWRSAIEVAILWVAIYYGYLYLRGTRGAKVFTGFALLFLFLIFISQILQLMVIGWLIKSLTAFLAIAMVVIFQPELRRALAALGSHRFFSAVTQNTEAIELLTETVFELSNRQLGALLAIERETNVRQFAESGVAVDSEISSELIITIFHPRTPLHDGGVVIRNDRIASAACIFPVSQREDLDRNLGLRHRAAIGISEESDAIAVVVSEETGNVSICHRGTIERNFDPESFRRRLGELMLLPENNDEGNPIAQLGGKGGVAGPGHLDLVPHQKKRRDDLDSVQESR
jgi:diadenylate cyclase